MLREGRGWGLPWHKKGSHVGMPLEDAVTSGKQGKVLVGYSQEWKRDFIRQNSSLLVKDV